MNLFVEHDAAALASLAGQPRPHCDGLIVRHGRLDDVLAASIRSNPLAETWLIDLDLPAERIVTWSGTLSAGLFEIDPATWSRRGQEAFAAFCREIGPQLEQHDRRVCFHPHSRHVLSDGPSCLRFLQQRPNDRLEVAFAPASMIEPSMLPMIDDHLTRMFELLGGKCVMAILNDVKLVEDAAGPRCEATPLGQGCLPRDLVLGLMEKHLPPELPIVISPGSLERQFAWLGGESRDLSERGQSD